jgi:hypothetical protein
MNNGGSTDSPDPYGGTSFYPVDFNSNSSSSGIDLFYGSKSARSDAQVVSLLSKSLKSSEQMTSNLISALAAVRSPKGYSRDRPSKSSTSTSTSTSISSSANSDGIDINSISSDGKSVVSAMRADLTASNASYNNPTQSSFAGIGVVAKARDPTAPQSYHFTRLSPRGMYTADKVTH